MSEDRTEARIDKPENVEMLTFFPEMVTQDESMNGGNWAAPQGVWSGGYARHLSDVFYLRENPANAMTQSAREIRNHLVSSGATR